MRRIENKKVILLQPGTEKPLTETYAKLCLVAIDSPPERGFTAADIRKRNRVAVVIEKNIEADFFDLEDADLQTLKECIGITRWRFRSQAIGDFLDYIEQGGIEIPALQ